MHPVTKEKSQVLPQKLSSFFKIFTQRYIWYVSGLLLFALISAFFNTSIDYELNIGILDSFVSEKTKPIFSLITYFLLHITMDRLFCFLAQKLTIFYKPRIINDVMTPLYMQVMRHSLHWFATNPAQKISKAVHDFQHGLTSFVNALFSMARHGFLVVICLIFVKKICFTSAVILIVFIMTYIPIIFSLLKRQLKIEKRFALSKKRSLDIFNDAIKNALGVKTLGSLFQDFSFKLMPSLQKWGNWSKKTIAYQAYYIAIADTILLLAMIAVQLAVITHYYRQGILRSPGHFTFIAVASLKMHYELSEFLKKIVLSLKPKIEDIRQSYTFITASPHDLDPPNARSLSAAHGAITYTDVSFAYEPGKDVLKNLNVTMLPGQKIAIIGEPGSGKKTFIKCLLKYFPPSKGFITIGGQDIAMVTQESLSDHIALIPQCVPLFQRSVLDNLRMAAPNASLKDMEDVCKKAKIHQEIMGMPDAYHTLLGDHGLPLSEATRQGFAVARALLKKAPILIVEESPSVLDTPTERLIESSLNAIMEDSTATQLVLAHKLSTLIHMDRILIFDKGSLVQDGTHDQLSKESGGIYKKLLDDRYRHF